MTIFKTCPKCKIEKRISDFYNNKSQKSGKDRICKICSRNNTDNYQKNNKEKCRNSKILSKSKIRKNSPWKFSLYDAKNRCENKNNPRYFQYGGRGIKCLITSEELKEIWFRDKAYEMKKPSIDRIDNDGNYEYKNCQYIEFEENSAKDQRKSIIQLSVDGKIINEFISTKDAENRTGFSHKCIGRVALGQRKIAYGYIWKYKEIK